MSECDRCRADLGAYVLDGLQPEEADAVEAHLRGCASCRAEHAGLAAAAGLLELAREAPPSVPSRVRDRVVADAARRRSRTRWAAVAAVAAVVAALGGGVAGWAIGSARPAVVAVPLDSPAEDGPTGWARVAAVDGALVLELEATGLAPLDEPGVYEAWVSTTEGDVVSIGQLAPVDGEVSARLVAEGPPAAYRGFWVTAEPDAQDPAHDGPTVLQAPLPGEPDG